jgi:hypothetical protein
VKRLIALSLAGIALLTAGSMLAIYWATEPPAAVAARSRPPDEAALGRSPGAFDPSLAPPSPQALPMASLPAPGVPPPAEAPLPDYTAPAVPIANTAPPIQTAPIVDLPDGVEERQEALLELRRRRFASQMDELNRRSAARAGMAAPAPSPAPAPGPGGPRSATPPSRRGSLSPAAPPRPASPPSP